MHNFQEKWIKEQLEQETTFLSFTEEMNEAVLKRVSRTTSFWDQEITLHIPKGVVFFSVVLIIVATLMLQIVPGMTDQDQPATQKQQLIDLDTGIFSESELRQFIKK